MAQLVSEMRTASPLSSILIAHEPKLSIMPNNWDTDYRDAIREFVIADGNIAFVDQQESLGSFGTFLNNYGDRYSLLAPDGLHPEDTGHYLVAHAMFDATAVTPPASVLKLIEARVSGPTSAGDNHIARYDGITGEKIQDSSATIDDTGNMTLPAGTLSVGGGTSTVTDGTSSHGKAVTLVGVSIFGANLGAQYFANTADTQPTAAFGHVFGGGFLAYGPGGSTVADTTLTRTGVGQFSINGGTITGSGTPTNASDLVTKTYADGKIGGTTGTVDNQVLRADGTAGKTAQSADITIDDNGNILQYTANKTYTASSPTLLEVGGGTSRTITMNGVTLSINGISYKPNISFSQTAAGTLMGYGFINQPTYSNTTTVAANLGPSAGFIDSATYKGDGAAISLGGFGAAGSFESTPTFTVANSGTLTVPLFVGLLSTINVNFSSTITTRKGVWIEDATLTGAAANIGTQVGIDVDSLVQATTNIGIRIAKAGTYALQLSDTSGVAAGGVTFGTDTNLYRSAANTLKTDDNLLIPAAGTASHSALTNDATQTVKNKDLTDSSNTFPTLTLADKGLSLVGKTIVPTQGMQFQAQNGEAMYNAANYKTAPYIEVIFGDSQIEFARAFDGVATRLAAAFPSQTNRAGGAAFGYVAIDATFGWTLAGGTVQGVVGTGDRGLVGRPHNLTNLQIANVTLVADGVNFCVIDIPTGATLDLIIDGVTVQTLSPSDLLAGGPTMFYKSTTYASHTYGFKSHSGTCVVEGAYFYSGNYLSGSQAWLLGLSGSQAAQWASTHTDFITLLKQINPHGITIEPGRNDAGVPTSPSALVTALETLRSSLRTAFPKATIRYYIAREDANTNAVGWHSTWVPAITTWALANDVIPINFDEVTRLSGLENGTTIPYKWTFDGVHLSTTAGGVCSSTTFAVIAGLQHPEFVPLSGDGKDIGNKSVWQEANPLLGTPLEATMADSGAVGMELVFGNAGVFPSIGVGQYAFFNKYGLRGNFAGLNDTGFYMTGVGIWTLSNVLQITGNTGATALYRLAGSTAQGAPTSGTYVKGDFIWDGTGKAWICTTAGTPGTWVAAASNVPRTSTITSQTNPTCNTDLVDFLEITAQAVNVASFTAGLSGTPLRNQRLRIAITDNGTARTITWGTSFEASTVALPTTTVISTRLDIEFVWNAVTSKWRCIRAV